MELPTLTRQQFDQHLRPFLDMLEDDFQMSLAYIVENAKDGSEMLITYREKGETPMPQEEFDERVARLFSLVEQWVLHLEASHGIDREEYFREQAAADTTT